MICNYATGESYEQVNVPRGVVSVEYVGAGCIEAVAAVGIEVSYVDIVAEYCKKLSAGNFAVGCIYCRVLYINDIAALNIAGVGDAGRLNCLGKVGICVFKFGKNVIVIHINSCGF